MSPNGTKHRGASPGWYWCLNPGYLWLHSTIPSTKSKTSGRLCSFNFVKFLKFMVLSHFDHLEYSKGWEIELLKDIQ